MSGGEQQQKGTCFSFRDSGSCKFGDKCRFPHVTEQGEVISQGHKDAPEPGSWSCPQCTNVNYSFRRVCNRCNNPRTMDDGSWACPSCDNLNYPHRTRCNRCTYPRPEGVGNNNQPGYNASQQQLLQRQQHLLQQQQQQQHSSAWGMQPGDHQQRFQQQQQPFQQPFGRQQQELHQLQQQQFRHHDVHQTQPQPHFGQQPPAQQEANKEVLAHQFVSLFTGTYDPVQSAIEYLHRWRPGQAAAAGYGHQGQIGPPPMYAAEGAEVNHA